MKEWRRALENHDYYLAQSKKDNKPWFQHPKCDYQYSEFVYLTPDMAQDLLDHMPLNRRAKSNRITSIHRDILNNRWLQTHESIAINTLGNMHDGQHRAHGIKKANTGWPIYCTWNVPPEAIYVTDSGDKRPINEKLTFLFPDLKMTNKTAAMCRSMMWGLNNRSVRYTESEIADFMIKYQDVVGWVISRMGKYRADLQAVIGKAVLWWGEELVGPFVERLREVQFIGDGDPVKALYLWLQTAIKRGRSTSYTGPIIYYKKTLAAIHAHASGKQVARIMAKEQDVFEWLPGWVIPDNSPCKGEIFLPS